MSSVASLNMIKVTESTKTPNAGAFLSYILIVLRLVAYNNLTYFSLSLRFILFILQQSQLLLKIERRVCSSCQV